jgi:hypothetical protein
VGWSQEERGRGRSRLAKGIHQALQRPKQEAPNLFLVQLLGSIDVNYFVPNRITVPRHVLSLMSTQSVGERGGHFE